MQKFEKARDKLISLLKESPGNTLPIHDAVTCIREEIPGKRVRINRFVKRFPGSFHVKDNCVKLGPSRLQNETFIDNDDTLSDFLNDWNAHGSKASYIALGGKCAKDLEEEKLSVIQIAWPCGERIATYAIDVLSIKDKGMKRLKDSGLFSAPCCKFIHDARITYSALESQYGIELKYVFDTQLALEAITGKFQGDFDDLLEHFGSPPDEKDSVRRSLRDHESCWQKRPSRKILLTSAVEDIKLLLTLIPKIMKKVEIPNIPTIAVASKERVVNYKSLSKGNQRVVFDKDGQFLSSYELRSELTPALREPKVDNREICGLLSLLPTSMRANIPSDRLTNLREIMLDIGQPPIAIFTDTDPCTEIDLDNQPVTKELLAGIGANLEFGKDDRATLERQLHRVSRKLNKRGEIDAMTFRIGRPVENNTDLIRDLISDPERSILFLGHPGSGKTTVIRTVAAEIRKQSRVVMIVDTSNEIAGNGDAVHPLLGRCRRYMVPDIKDQAELMVRAVQNHTPHTIVIDEIGRKQEVAAAQTVKTRGVRMIASAHGSFRELMANPELKRLLGSFQTVILPGFGKKSVTERTGQPAFDTIVEVVSHNCFRVIRDVQKAVDNALEGKEIQVEERRFDSEPENGRYPFITLSYKNA